MKSFLVFFLGSILLIPSAPTWGQERPAGLLSASVPIQDWSVGSLEDVRYGRVVVVEDNGTTHLELRRLLAEAPVASPPGSASAVPDFSGNSLVVGDFSVSNQTPLGGFYGTFQRLPSQVEADVVRFPDGRRGLELRCDRRTEGFCGLWVQLYDFEVPRASRTYLDTGPFSNFSFWIRGKEGGEELLLKVADEAWERREDALPIGDIGEFLPSGRIETTWQQAVVPVHRFPPRIRKDLLAMMTFEVLVPGMTSVEFGPMAFSVDPGPLPSLPAPVPDETPVPGLQKATWLWNTVDLLADETHAREVLDFLELHGFDNVFLQLPGIPGASRVLGEVPVDIESMRPLVGAFNARGIKVYALDGFARYALPEYHAGVLKTIDHVVRYNAEVTPDERFYGIRYDIEPYLLPEFHGPGRDRILTLLLDITRESVERSNRAGMVYGVDIPFWYDALSEETSERVTVSYGGVEKPVSEHLIDLVDNIAIMDYRTVAYGADGTVRHGTGEMEYASAVGKPVFIGLETFALPDETLLDFRGPTQPGLPVEPPVNSYVVIGMASDSVHAAFVSDPALDPEGRAELVHWMEGIGLAWADVAWWPIDRRVEVPASKITFAGQDPADLEKVIRATTEAFRGYDAFAGFAIHFVRSYMEFLGY
jgi:hypothetical protein